MVGTQHHDPVYGTVTVDEPVVLAVLESKTMQRLKGVDVAGNHKGFFSGKTYTRFDHSVGVYLLLKQFGASLEEQLAGLIHDVSHSAFSHAIDYALAAGSETEHSHQDNVFADYVRASELPLIFGLYGMNTEHIIDDARHPLKETQLPDLCADRIDYALRWMVAKGKIAPKEVHAVFLVHLRAERGAWVFDSVAVAEQFATMFARLNDELWSCCASAAMLSSIGDTLKYALAKEYITEDDCYTTDAIVLGKLRGRRMHDATLDRNLRRMEGRVAYHSDPEHGTVVHCKSRVVDPWCMDGDARVRLSEAKPEWKERIEQGLEPKEYHIAFED